MTLRSFGLPLLAMLALIAPSQTVAAQPRRADGPPAPTVVSPEVTADRRITFRIYAPEARAIRLNAGDIQASGKRRS